jgi:N-acyl homoserine lactone hydrolase
MKEKTRVRRMFVLNGGSFLFDVGMMKFGRDLDKRQRIITPFFAFDTEEGWILYDTGWPPEIAPELEKWDRDPDITEAHSALRQLQNIKISPSDVAKVIVSHLHLDHAGGIQFFPEAQVYVQKDEFSYAHYPNSFQTHLYLRSTFDLPQIKWEILEGDQVIVPGLTVMLASGHTPGLQGLIAELPESGFYILASDSAYLKEAAEKGIPPGNAWNPVLAQYSVKRFKTLESVLGGRFFPGHDYHFYTNEVVFENPYL